MELRVSGITDLLSASLNISEPWYIRSVETREAAVHIEVSIRGGNKLPCPECGKMCLRAGYEKEERVWRHGDIAFYPCYVHCRRPRVRCEEHGTKVVAAPWARKTSRFTTSFEGYAVLVLMNMPIRKAAQLMRCNEKSLVKILHYWVDKAVNEDDLSAVKALAIDETSYKRGHQYVTVIGDAEERRVIDVEDGRSMKAVVEFSKKLEEKHGSCDAINRVSSDMSGAFRAGIEMCFPYALQTIDKFHVKKLLIDAMDKVRKAEQKEHKSKELHLAKRILMIPEGKQTDEQKERISTLCRSYPKTGRAFRMVQALDTVYSSNNYESGKARFEALCSWLRRSRLEPMKTAGSTLISHEDQILNYFVTRMTNAFSEGINSLIQAAKRRARGYRTFEGFAAIIYLIVGKLKLACPNPLR